MWFIGFRFFSQRNRIILEQLTIALVLNIYKPDINCHLLWGDLCWGSLSKQYQKGLDFFSPKSTYVCC